MTALGSNESLVLGAVSTDWRTVKDIVWDINGPRELTIPECNLKSAMATLCRKRILESRPPQTQRGEAALNRQYRLRAQ